MSTYAALLLQGAEEVREYKKTQSAKSFGEAWFDRIADDMEKASTLSNLHEIEQAIDTLAHRLTDSGPMEVSPSFGKALDALQRSRKKKHV